MRSSDICGNRKSGARSWPAPRTPGPPRSISQYQSAKMSTFVSQITTPATIRRWPLETLWWSRNLLSSVSE
jgi:hypothetical protein